MLKLDDIIKEFLSEKISAMAAEGYSVYEITDLLNIHPKLITKITGKGGTHLKLESNNRNFILKINAKYSSLFLTDLELRKYNFISGDKGKIFFTGKRPDTFKKWEKGLSLSLKEELEEWKQRAIQTVSETGWIGNDDDDIADLSETETENAGWENKELAFYKQKGREEQIISDHLDGISTTDIGLKHSVSELYITQLIDKYHLPQEFTISMIEERVKRIIRKRVSRKYLEWRFSHISPARLAQWMSSDTKPKEQKMYVTADEAEAAEPVKKKKKINISKETDALIIDDYMSGSLPDAIAKKFKIELNYILKLLYTRSDYSFYYKKNVADTNERNKAIADYYKRGWRINDLILEFKMNDRKLKKILADKGFNVDAPEYNFLKKKQKVDLVTEYFKKGKNIFDIAERLIMTPERVEYLLKKKGLIEEDGL